MIFPRPRTRFVGRARDLARLAELVGAGTSIVTLWGPPGIGKTRLATELCRAGKLARDGQPARAWFCDLAAARDVSDICGAAIRALGVEAPVQPAGPAWIGAALAAQPPGVLVLDNFEQVVEHVTETVAAWAEKAAQICFMVTSRERLRVGGEVTHEVLPLDEAAELFLDRARAAAGAVAMDPEAVARLVARLEGIPLAIELAAARVDLLGVEGLLSRLGRPLDLLGRGARDSGRNHATLRDAIDSSFRLLAPIERDALAQCAVFQGGFSLEAAEAVLALDPGARVLDVLEVLRDRSLVRCTAEHGAVRFGMFESIRAYALDALVASRAADDARARHARYYLRAALPAFTADLSNVEAAIAHALDAAPDGRPRGLGDILAALARIEPSLLSDALLDALGRALVMAEGDTLPAPLLARAHRARSKAAQLRGRLADAQSELECALTLARDEPALAAELLVDLGVVHHQLRRMERARECYEAALAVHERLGDAVAKARCLGNLGAVHHDLRRYDAALDDYQRALGAFRAAGEHRLEGGFLTNMAVLLQERGARAQARATYAQALERLALTRDRRLEAIARTNLGLLCHEMGELDEACSLHMRALAALREVVDPRSEGLCLGRLAMAQAALGRGEEARGSCLRAEPLLGPLDDRIAAGVLRLFRAFVDLAAGGGEAIARARLAEARVASWGDGASLVDLSDDARAAVRLIEASLASSGAAGVLVMGPRARWFTPPGGAVQDLAGRRVLRRLLLRLVQHHREAPGEGLALDVLREAGWPGDRATPAAASNRVHVALTELRRRGLRAWLLRTDAGYLIDPALRVELSDR